MMQQWCSAILRDPSFRQQLDPITGDFTQSGSASYSPCALVLYDYTWRLAGVRKETDARRQGDELHWNINPECPAARNATFRVAVGHRATAELRYLSGNAELRINDKFTGHLQGTARLVTDLTGKPTHLVGLHSNTVNINLQLAGHPSRELTISPNDRIVLSGGSVALR
jgi:hypothetical protein